MTRRRWTGRRAARPSGPLLLVAALLVLWPAPVVGQQKPDSKPRQEQILEKIRTRANPLQRDTTAPDSASGPEAAAGRAPGAAAIPAAGGAGGPVPAAGQAAGAVPRRQAPPAGGGIGRDSIMDALLRLEGYTPMEYEGAGARFQADSGRVELVGTARVVRGEQSMTADSLLVYNQKASTVCGYGNPVLTGPGAPVESEQVCYNVDTRLGLATGAKTEFQQGAKWILHGNEVYTRGSSRIYGRHTDFTSCDLEEPHYHFSAGEVKVISDSVMVARNITLNFGDVPVLWLPIMMQSMKQGRRSGLLMPRFSLNDIARTSSGYRRKISNVGFYWAINDYMGAQVTMEWFSERHTSVDGTLDFNWKRQFLRGNIGFRQFWPTEGGRQFTLRANTSWQPTERTTVRMNANYASSSDFVRRNTFDPMEMNRSLGSNVGLSHRFDWGSLSLSARRQQFLTDNRVQMTAPSVDLSISPITLFKAPAGQASWYNNATWGASASFSADRTDVDEALVGTQQFDRRNRRAQVSSRFQLGKFSWNQNISFQEQARDALVSAVGDTLGVTPLASVAPGSYAVVDTLFDSPEQQMDTLLRAEQAVQTVEWNTGISYTQRLIGTSTLTPRISLRGTAVRSEATGSRLVSGPMRINFGAGLQTNVYGFWPGVGPFSRFRHKISPSLSYSYSPKPPALTPQQEAIFGAAGGREQNQLRIGLRQTFEAKYESEDGDTAAAAPDTAAATGGGPRRRPQSRKVKLLSLTTSAVAYDFVRAREGGDWLDGLTTTSLSHTVSSDLLRGLSLSFSHDLFDEQTSETGARSLSFAPHLSRVNASFSLSPDSKIFQLLGLGGGDDGADDEAAADSVDTDVGPQVGGVGGMMPGGYNTPTGGRAGNVGDWRASLRYSLTRPRREDARGSQMLSGTVSFQPTEKWSVHWNTAFSVTDREFGQHVFTLTRDLHRWQANFDFVKAPNGNFSFQFRVQLRDNPDIKLDYEQRGEAIGGRRY